MSDVTLNGMPGNKFASVPTIIDGVLHACAFDKKGSEVEVRWDLSKITPYQAEQLAAEFSKFATSLTHSFPGRQA